MRKERRKERKKKKKERKKSAREGMFTGIVISTPLQLSLVVMPMFDY